MRKPLLKSTFIPLVLSIVVFSFANVSFANFGDVSYIHNPATFTTATGQNASSTMQLSCVIGQNLEALNIYTRSTSGTRTVYLFVDNATTTSATINTTPGFAQFTPDVPCLDGTLDVYLSTVGTTHYLYWSQPNSFAQYSLYRNIGGGDRLILNQQTWSLPLTGMATSSNTIDMATTTKVLEVFSTQFLFYSLIMIVIASITLIFTIRKR